MKKILFVATFSAFTLVSGAQMDLNGEYSDKIAGRSEVPVKLIYFLGNMNDNRLLLKWNVSDNESANLFEVEKSYDGKDFFTGGLIFSSEKNGNETYFFPQLLKDQEKIFYRLKIIDKNQKVKYSKVLSFQPIPIAEKNSLASLKML
jgi:hypothetical protein